jgi:hypothetical protein
MKTMKWGLMVSYGSEEQTMKKNKEGEARKDRWEAGNRCYGLNCVLPKFILES